MRLSATKAKSTNQYRGLGDQLYDLGGARPTLDLNFATNKSLVDSVTGKTLVTHTRASSATYVDGDGVIQTASTDTPRFDHDPATGESLGLLLEEARTNLLPNSELDGSSYVLAMLTRTLTTEINPAGEAATRRFQANTGSGLHRTSLNSFSNNSVTVSAFVKKDTHRYVNIGYGGLQNSFSALFDIEPGLTSDRLLGQGVKGTTSTNISAGYQDFSNGWVRIWATGTTTGGNGFSLQLARDETTFSLTTWSAAGTEAIYAWGAQLEDDAEFPTSLIPTAGATVTRAADLTSIATNDFGTFNLLQYSEDLSNVWTKYNTTISLNVIEAPDGTISADKLIETTANNFHRIRQSISSATTGVFSVYVKADERTRFELGTSDTTPIADFNLTTGTVESGTGTIESVGNGWYRVSVYGTFTTSGPFILLRNDTTEFYTGDGTSGMYIWGAQLEESSTATPYVKSDVTFTSRASTATYYDYNGVIQTAAVDEARNAAFLPDSNGNFVSAGELLLEEARTNLVTYSVAVIGNGWSKVGPPVPVNLSLNELGVFTGVRTISGGATWHGISSSCNLTAGITYNTSVWYKIGDVNPSGKFRILHKLAGVTGASQLVRNGSDPMDISDHVITSNSSHGTISNVTVKNLSNGVYQVSYNFVPVSTGFYQLTVSPSSTVVGESVITLGAQIEEGSYPTSYIPTSGATVTRAADVSSSSANTFGNSFYDQTKSTLYVNYNKSWDGNWGAYRGFFKVWDGTAANTLNFALANGGNNQVYISGLTNNVSQYSYIAYNAVKGRNISASVFANNDVSVAYDGNTIGNDSTATLPVVNQAIMQTTNTQISRIIYWPQRLSNATLQTITN